MNGMAVSFNKQNENKNENKRLIVCTAILDTLPPTTKLLVSSTETFLPTLPRTALEATTNHKGTKEANSPNNPLLTISNNNKGSDWCQETSVKED